MKYTDDQGEQGVETPPASNHTAIVGGDLDMAGPKSTKSPAFQFYPRDFLSSSKVDAMSMTERGVYITFMSRCWLDGGLPTDMKKLATMARMKQPQFERLWTNGPLHECFYLKADTLQNERLDKERKGQVEYRKKQKGNADARWDKARNATALPPPDQSHPSGNALRSASSSSTASASSSVKHVQSAETPAFDAAFHEFTMAYPSQGRIGSHLAMTAFVDVVSADPGAFQALMARLSAHNRSHLWRVKGMIPRMDRYLRDGYHLQELPEHPPSMLVNDKTARTLTSAEEFARGSDGPH